MENCSPTCIGFLLLYLYKKQINELKPAPNFSLGPLQEFGQPQGPEWIHDALSASQWTTPGTSFLHVIFEPIFLHIK